MASSLKKVMVFFDLGQAEKEKLRVIVNLTFIISFPQDLFKMIIKAQSRYNLTIMKRI